jgi:hypothetical protein
VAGASTTRREETGSATTTVAASNDSVNGRTPLSFGVLIGALAASILLLALAALPLIAAPGRAGLLIERRVEMAVVGTLTLLVITVFYLASVG